MLQRTGTLHSISEIMHCNVEQAFKRPCNGFSSCYGTTEIVVFIIYLLLLLLLLGIGHVGGSRIERLIFWYVWQ